MFPNQGIADARTMSPTMGELISDVLVENTRGRAFTPNPINTAVYSI